MTPPVPSPSPDPSDATSQDSDVSPARGHLRLVHDGVAGTNPVDGRITGSASARTPIDRTIVSAATRGDERAFTELVRWYHPRFVRFARHMLRNDAEADDAVQEAFIRVYKDKVPIVAMSIQEPTLEYVNAETGKPYTRDEFERFASVYLGVDDIFWSRESPWLRDKGREKGDSR